MTRQFTITAALLAFLSFSGQWHDSAAAFSPAWAPSNGTDNGGRTPACVIRNGSGQEAGAIPACATSGQRSVQLLTEWEFRRDHDMQAAEGWEKVSDKTAVALALAMKEMGVKTIVYTDISRDGMLSGPNIEQTKFLSDKTGIDIIASGGMSCMEDLRNVYKAGIHGAIMGKALYEKKIILREAVAEFEK